MRSLAILMTAAFCLNGTAATKQNYCGTSHITNVDECRNIPENRREELGREIRGGNPVAVASSRGNLFVYYTVSGGNLQKCQVAGNVADFKVSSNPGDVAAAYYIARGDALWDLRISGEVARGRCPKADKKDMLSHSGMGGKVVKRNGKYVYRIVPNSRSRTVGLALTTRGTLEWTDRHYQKHEWIRSFEAFDSLWNDRL